MSNHKNGRALGAVRRPWCAPRLSSRPELTGWTLAPDGRTAFMCGTASRTTAVVARLEELEELGGPAVWAGCLVRPGRVEPCGDPGELREVLRACAERLLELEALAELEGECARLAPGSLAGLAVGCSSGSPVDPGSWALTWASFAGSGSGAGELFGLELELFAYRRRAEHVCDAHKGRTCREVAQ